MDKSALRSEYLEKRASLSVAQFTAANQQIWQHLKGVIPWNKITALHTYLPLVERREIDTTSIIAYTRQHHPDINLVVPKVHQLELQHHQIYPDTKFISNQWGIPEPVSTTAFPIGSLDLVIVPLLIFDKQGHRVGYGKGYYDRFLGQCHPGVITIGLSLFPPVSEIATDAYDIPLLQVVTPHQVFTFG